MAFGNNARWLWENFSHCDIDDLLQEYYELRRDPQERQTEKVDEALDKMMRENKDEFDKYFGLP